MLFIGYKEGKENRKKRNGLVSSHLWRCHYKTHVRYFTVNISNGLLYNIYFLSYLQQ